MQRMAKTRGVRGAAGQCALAAILYLLAKYLLTALISFLMGARVAGSSLAAPTGFSQATVLFFELLIGVGAFAAPLFWLLCTTRLRAPDLRLTIPAGWSPGFCLCVFLGLANAGNVLGGLLGRLLGSGNTATALPQGGSGLLMAFLTLCVMPAVCEELFFRGALQGLMRPCGSAVAIFAPALLFALLHFDLAQGITAILCAVFLGWLTERIGSILPGMLLHFINNCLAFLSLYLGQYAPGDVALAYQLVLLLALPPLGLWMAWRAHRQGFRFSSGMRPGVAPLAFLSTPAYLVAVVFLLAFGIFLAVAHG